MKHAPIALQPVTSWTTPCLSSRYAVAVRTSDKDLQAQLERVLHAERDAIRSILTEFGVPLVRCDTCLVSGDLPSHDPTRRRSARRNPSVGAPAVSVAQLNGWLPLRERQRRAQQRRPRRRQGAHPYLLDKKPRRSTPGPAG